MKKLTLTFSFVATLVGSLAATEPELALDQLDRSIDAEPEYVSSEPRYGLYVLDAQHRTHVWAVLDKSTPEGAEYNVLYFDRNANGKLTDDGERFEAETGNSFALGDFVDPHTQDTHTKLKLRVADDCNVMFGLNWKGKHRVAGGYAVKPGPYTRFAKSPDEAPVVKLVGQGAFSFQTWMAPDSLKIGAAGHANDVKFFIGHAGVGPHTFTSMMHPFLPQDVALEVTLAYESTSGELKELTSVLKDRC